VKNSIFAKLFPRPPSAKEMAARRAANRRGIVAQVSTGSYLLQMRKYATETDIAKKREQALGCK
jgi:hypothetical protein